MVLKHGCLGMCLSLAPLLILSARPAQSVLRLRSHIPTYGLAFLCAPCCPLLLFYWQALPIMQTPLNLGKRAGAGLNSRRLGGSGRGMGVCDSATAPSRTSPVPLVPLSTFMGCALHLCDLLLESKRTLVGDWDKDVRPLWPDEQNKCVLDRV